MQESNLGMHYDYYYVEDTEQVMFAELNKLFPQACISTARTTTMKSVLNINI